VATKLKGRDLLCLKDFSKEEILEIISFGDKLKMDSMVGKQEHYLEGKSVAMIFQKASTRTRVSFEVAAFELGAHALYLNANDMQLHRGETISDTAHVLSRYVAGIVARVFAHQDLIDLAANSDSPIINALSDLSHPCQILGDLMTIREKKGTLKGLRLAYVGDGNNVANSLLLGAARVGMNIAIASPKGFEPREDIVKTATEIAKQSDSSVLVTNDPLVSVQDVDVVYTDVWASMGQEAEHAALFAGSPWRRDHRRSSGRPSEHGIRPGREQASYPEGGPGSSPRLAIVLKHIRWTKRPGDPPAFLL
jgi:ornithine carbamoyltransferase